MLSVTSVECLDTWELKTFQCYLAFVCSSLDFQILWKSFLSLIVIVTRIIIITFINLFSYTYCRHHISCLFKAQYQIVLDFERISYRERKKSKDPTFYPNSISATHDLPLGSNGSTPNPPKDTRNERELSMPRKNTFGLQ